MKKIRYLLVWLLLILITFVWSKTNAYTLRNLHNQSQYSYWSIKTSGDPEELKMNTDSFYVGNYAYYLWNLNNATNTPQWYFSNGWRFQSISSIRPSDLTTTKGSYYSNVKFEDDWAWGRNMYRFSQAQKNRVLYNIPSKAWFLYTFSNGSQVLLDDVYFRHNSIIFQNHETYDTVQLVNDGGYGQRVFWCDPQENWQNFYMIDFKNQKARSTHQTKNYCFAVMFGEIKFNPTVLSNINFDYSYTLSRWSQYLRPQTVWVVWAWPDVQISKEDYDQDMRTPFGWTYSQDIEFVEPNINWNTNWSTGWTLVPDNSYEQVFNDYNACYETYSYYNAIANSRKACLNDLDNWKITLQEYSDMSAYIQSVDDIITNWSWSYPISTWSVNCTLMVENARSFAKNEIIDKPNMYMSDYQVAIEDIKLKKTVDNPYNITALCGEKPVNPNTWNPATDYDCNLSSRSNIANCFKFWSDPASSWSDASLFDTAVDNMSIMVSNSFLSKFLSPIQQEFNAWRTKISGVQCVVQPYFNFPDVVSELLPYIIALLLFFILYWLL